MPRQIRIEYPSAIYHVLSRGDRRGFLPTHFRRLIKRQLREFPQQISKGFYPVNPVHPVKMSFLVKAAA